MPNLMQSAKTIDFWGLRITATRGFVSISGQPTAYYGFTAAQLGQFEELIAEAKAFAFDSQEVTDA